MLVRDHEKYRHLREVADTLVVRGLGYPDYVFQKKYLNYQVMESEVAVEFDLLQSLAELYGDSTINLLHYEPDGEQFWFKRHGHYGAITVSSKSDGKDWNSDINEDPSGDFTFLYTAYGQAVIFGDSGEWCIYRCYSFDFAVLAMNKNLSSLRITNSTQYVHDADWAVDIWKSSGSRMDEEFYDIFIANYSNQKFR